MIERPARACVGFVVDGLPRIEPVRVRHEENRYLVGFEEASMIPHPQSEAVLVVDEGTLFFDLRAVYVRGETRSADPEFEDGVRWIVLKPVRVSSWDYGRMRWERARD